MKLDGKEGQFLVDNAFVGVVIGVIKPSLKTIGKFFFVHRKSVVLSGDVATFGVDHYSWLILGTVAKFEFVCVASRGKSQKLIA